MVNSGLPCYPVENFIPVARQYADAAGVKHMARLLGDAVLPEQVQSRRRSLRNRLTELRQPVRRFREQNIPGPNVVGMVGNNLTDLRDRFVSRTTVLERIQERRQNGGMMQGEQQEQGGNAQGSGSTSGSDRRTVN